jgi:signal transduction histidine kinase
MISEEGVPAIPGRPRPLVDKLRQLDHHDHVGLVFESEEERAESAGLFMRIGLERRERCVHFGDPTSAGHVMPFLREGSSDVGLALASGALTLDTRRAATLRSATPWGGDIVALLESTVKSALDSGYKGLRVSGELLSAFGGVATLDRYFECETALKRLFRERPLVALFQYDRRKCSQGMLAGVLRLHPFVLHRGELHRNWLYVPHAPASGPGTDDGTVKLIAERDRAEVAFARSGERLRHALEGGAHGLWDWDLSTNRVALNRRWGPVTGLDPSRASVTVAEFEETVHPDDLGPLWRALQDHMEGHVPRLEFEFRVKAEPGWHRVLMRGAVVARDHARRPARMSGTFTDVTLLRTRSDQESGSERLATIGLLAGGVAHEINNPLAWITANLEHVKELLVEGFPPDATIPELATKLTGIVEETKEGAARIRDTVRALRALTSPGDGTLPFDVRGELLKAVAQVRAELPRWTRLNVSLPPELPSAQAHPAVGRVFVNLLAHAARSVPEGQGSTDVRVSARTEGDFVLVEIADTGLGASVHEREHTFDVIAVGDHLEHAVRLPLPFSRMILEASGGRLEFESTTGGTRALMELPIVRGAPLAAPESDEGATPQAKASSPQQ